MRPPAESKALQWSLAAALTCLFAVLAFCRLGDRPLASYDEAIYAQVAREAWQHHHPFTFTWVGSPEPHQLWFDKPPLMIWLVETAYRLFGVNEFAARFWTALFATATLPLTWLFVKKLFNSATAALLAMAGLFAAFQFVDYSRILQMDIPVGFFTLLALFGLWQARTQERYHALFWIAIGLGVMVKSVIGLLPLAIMLAFSAATNDFTAFKRRWFWAGSLLFILIVVPWHLAQHIRYGSAFWQQYLFYHVFERYTTTLALNGGPFYFYLKIFFQQQLWFWLIVMSLVHFGRCSLRSPAHRYVTISFLFILVFFSAAGTKLLPYILVIYPLAAAMIGVTLAGIERRLAERWTGAGCALIVVMLALSIFTSVHHHPFKSSYDSDAQKTADKAVGEFLRGYRPDEPVYYQSVNQVKPSIMFYADRPVGYFADYPRSIPSGEFLLIANVIPDYPDKTVVFSTDVEKVYQVTTIAITGSGRP